jgi:hypothetical protein
VVVAETVPVAVAAIVIVIVAARVVGDDRRASLADCGPVLNLSLRRDDENERQK